jgi:hypothetical protein
MVSGTVAVRVSAANKYYQREPRYYEFVNKSTNHRRKNEKERYLLSLSVTLYFSYLEKIVI